MGKTFGDLHKQHRRYCEWIAQQETTNVHMIEFAQFSGRSSNRCTPVGNRHWLAFDRPSTWPVGFSSDASVRVKLCVRIFSKSAPLRVLLADGPSRCRSIDNGHSNARLSELAEKDSVI